MTDNRPIVVIGSLNMDMIMRTARLPIGGETLYGDDFVIQPGGKGANQAVACARLGAPVAMIGRVGDDYFGPLLIQGLAQDDVDVSHIHITPGVHSGTAIVIVENTGQNRILIAPGANHHLDREDIDNARELIQGAALLVLQLESPIATISRAIELAREANVPILLNPAPATPLPQDIWQQVDWLVPNESEAAALSGVTVSDLYFAMTAGRRLHEKGAAHVLVTLGGQGVAIIDDGGARHLPAHSVVPVDTTAAGDTFIGALAVGLWEGMNLDDAAALGQTASALSVTRKGSQRSIPYRHELDNLPF